MNERMGKIFLADVGLLKKNTEFSITTINEIEQTIKKKAEEIENTKNWSEFLIFIDEIEKKYNIELSNLKEYFSVLASEPIAEAEKEELLEDEENLISALLEKLRFDKKQILPIPKKVSYETCKKLMKKIIEKKFEEGDRLEDVNNFVYPFIISENYNSIGVITSRKNAYPEAVTLINLKIKNNNVDIKFLGESIGFGNYFYAENFYLYNYECGGVNYLLLSKKEVKMGNTTVKGMKIAISDEVKSGAKAAISTKVNIILATELIPEIIKIENENDFWSVILKYNINKEELATALLGNLRHPEKFEKLLFSWLFAFPINNYPLHLLWIAEPGTGKSYTLEAIVNKAFSEEVAGADVSTVKYLIPSFGQTNFEPGYMIRRHRVGGIDELLKKIKTKDYDETGWFISALEHKERIVGSGKHTGTIIKPTARFIITSNPKYKISNIVEMQETLDNAFLSRFLIYRQTKAHVQFIRSRENIIRNMNDEDIYPKNHKWLIELFDYLTKKKLQHDFEDRINRIVEKYIGLLPYFVAETIYYPRIKHHISCIIDGIAKYNSILEKREKLCVMEKDIIDAEAIIGMCILSVIPNQENISKENLSLEDKLEFLTLSQLKVFDAIKFLGNPTVTEIESYTKEHASNSLDFLIENNFVNVKQNNNGHSIYSIRTVYDELLIKK